MSNEKPLAFLDIESTGISITSDRIVEIAIVKFMPFATPEDHSRSTYFINPEEERVGQEFHAYFNPGRPMNEEAMKITGLTDEFLMDFPSFKEVAPSIAEFLDGHDIAGHNIMKFDIPMLAEEFLRAGIDFPAKDTMFVDTFQNQAKIVPRTLEYCYNYYTGRQIDTERLHGAMFDTRVSQEIYLHQFGKHSQLLGTDRKALHDIATFGKQIVDFAGKLKLNSEQKICYAFGKYIDKPVTIDMKYVEWITGPTGDFTEDTKRWVRHAVKYKNEFNIPIDPADVGF